MLEIRFQRSMLLLNASHASDAAVGAHVLLGSDNVGRSVQSGRPRSLSEAIALL